MSFTPKKFPTDGSRYSVSFGHIETPDDFWITMPDNRDDYDALWDELNRVYKENYKANKLPAPLATAPWSMKVGQSCVYQLGECFSRGQVVAIKDGETVDLMDVDTGELTPLHPLKYVFPVLKNAFILHTPMFASHCKLYNVAPPIPGISQWSEDIVDHFKVSKTNF